MRRTFFSSMDCFCSIQGGGRFCFLLILLSLALPAQQQVEDITNPEQHYLYAAGLMQRNFYDLALPQLKIFLQRYPEHERAREVQRLLIYCYHALNKPSETLAGITQFRKQWPKDSLNEQFSVMAAVIRYQQNDFAGALQAYQELSQSGNPQIAETGVYYLGQCQLQLKQDAEAFATLLVLAERPLQPEFPYRAYAAFYVAGECLKKGDMKKAGEFFAKISKGKELPAEMREKALLRYADLEYEQRNYAAALAGYEEYILAFPKGSFQQQVRRQRMICAYRLQDYAKAADLGADWQTRYPQADDYELDLLQAQSLLELQRYEEALLLYGKVGRMKKIPEEYHFPSLLQELTCLSLLERHQELLSKGQELLAKFPNCSEKGRILFQLGKAAQLLHYQEQAEKFLRAAMEFFVGEKELFLTAADALLKSLLEGEKWSEAAMVCRRMSENVSPNLQAQYRLKAVEYEFKLENWVAVRTEVEQILKHWPDQPEVLISALQFQVHASLALEAYEEARTNLLRLQNLVAPNARGPIGLLLARVLLNLGKDREAGEVLQKTLVLPELESNLQVELEALLLRLYLEWEEKDAALPLLDKLLQLSEDERKGRISAQLWYAMGSLLISQQRYEDAEKALRLSLAEEQNLELKNQSAMSLAQILILLHRNEEASGLLNTIRDQNQQAGVPPSAELFSLLAELNLQLKRFDLSFAAVEQCFAAPGNTSLRSLTRARWVMATLLFEVEKDAKNALPYSIKCFVLADDPLYSPKAMQLAIGIYRALGNETDARTTWNELKQRYPLQAAGFQSSPLVKDWN
ncbi:MAG: tetratricopeptide repeat protein [Lentisphaeria bacterium]